MILSLHYWLKTKMKYHSKLEKRFAENKVIEIKLKTTNEKPPSVQGPSATDVAGMLAS